MSSSSSVEAPELPPQPLNVLAMSGEQICELISATHVPDDENFDADSLFVDVKNILKRATRMVDNVLLGQEHPENLEKKVSRASVDPLLCTLEQLSFEMAGKAPGVEIAHKTTMSIIGKLSNYSWNVKPALTLAAFALDYEDFFALPQLCSSHQLVESVENPKHLYVTLKHLDLQKYGKTIAELNKIINDTLDVMEVIFEWSKYAKKDIGDSGAYSSMVMDLVKEGVYWIIITVVACKTQMCCLTSNDDKTQDLLPLAEKMISTCRSEIEKKKERRKLKEALQAPDEIMEVFKVLIFARDDMQPLIDGSTNEMVSIDVLKNKDVLLFISSLDISNNDISDLMPIYDGIMMEDQYKIVWIPIVEQWTDDLRKKFEMLWSKMPWYIVQYFSPVAGLKFIKEELWFDNKPIVVVMNPQGELENENALDEIQYKGMEAFPFSRWCHVPYALVMKPPGPYAIEEYSFLYGGNDNKWIEQFSKKVISVAEDPVIKEECISIELSCVEKGHKPQRFWKRAETRKKTKSNHGSQEIQELLLSFKNESKWAVLTKWSTRVVSDHGTTILKVLEAFEEWKVNVPKRGFESCFKEYHDKLLQTGPLP